MEQLTASCNFGKYLETLSINYDLRKYLKTDHYNGFCKKYLKFYSFSYEAIKKPCLEHDTV